MATNRDLLKEAIADAKTVKNMAIANAKAALEESFTPQLTTMLSQKIQEMDELEEEEVCEECGGDHSSDTHMKESTADEDLNEVDLDELLSELDEGEDEDTGEVKEEKEDEDDAEEAEDDAEEAEDDADEAEDEALDLEDMTEEDFKKFVEDVIADMVDTGELEAGEGSEGEEVEGGEEEIGFEMEDEEEEVNIDELIAEIDSLEEFGSMNPDSKDSHGNIEDKGIFEDDDEELMTEDLKAWWERFKGSLGLGKLGEFNTAVLKWMQSNEQAIEDAKGSPQKGQDLLKRFEGEVKSKMDPKAFSSDRSSLMKVLGVSDTEGKTGHAGGGTHSESLQSENRILRSKLKEVKTANGVLNSELREINLLNSKLLYTNKIFKGKNLTESQKVKVLSTFDKASNVKEVRLIFETIKDSFKTTKKSINENYGSASRMLKGTGNKKPIIPVDDAFRRMQELAFYDQKH